MAAQPPSWGRRPQGYVPDDAKPWYRSNAFIVAMVSGVLLTIFGVVLNQVSKDDPPLPAAPSLHVDKLAVSGHFSLQPGSFAGAVLQVSLADGYMPHSGQSFDILDWGSLSGVFEQVQLPPLEQVFDLVVGDVQRAHDFTLAAQGYAHHAREPERDHALALAEGGVGERVAHDDGALRVDHLAHDAVADGP